MLEVNQLSFAYEEGKPILEDLSLQFNEGTIYGLLGANGSGKSTLFLSLMGLNRPQTGEVVFEGQPLKYHKRALFSYRQEVSLVFQNPDQQIFYSIVKDDVAFALRNLGYSEQEIQQRVDEALAQLGISELKEKPVQYLSYGQKKRVAIAGALALQTKWLLLDEPTAGLDPDGRRRMMAVIQELASRGKNIIISSHDMDLVYESCDYYYVLKAGKILLEGNKQAVFSDAALLATAKLEQPWLVKVQQELGLSFCQSEQAFLQQAKSIKNLLESSR